MRKYLDGIKTEPKTELEAHQRWLNRMQSSLAVLNRYRTRIPVIDYDLMMQERLWHNTQMIKLYGKNWRRDQDREDGIW